MWALVRVMQQLQLSLTHWTIATGQPGADQCGYSTAVAVPRALMCIISRDGVAYPPLSHIPAEYPG